MADRPVIGICASLETATYGVWTQLSALTPFLYVEAVQRAGGLAILIPPDPELVARPDEALDRIDGLLLAGGNDVDPSVYDAERHPQTRETVLARDEVELALARRASERDMPVLGICRGMQVMNVARGGTLHQHLPELVGDDRHRLNPGSFDGSDHTVVIDPGTLAAAAAAETRHTVKSHHHQAVDRLGEGLRVTGRSELDDLAEAVEDPSRAYFLGVQWHPEADPTSAVVATLVAGAADYRSRRGAS